MIWIVVALSVLALSQFFGIAKLKEECKGADLVIKTLVLQNGGSVKIERWAAVQSLQSVCLSIPNGNDYSLSVVYTPEAL